MFVQIFHKKALLGIKFLENGVLYTVEFKRGHAQAFAERSIERRRSLYPSALEKKFGITVKGHNVRAKMLLELFRGDVVAHVHKTQTTGDAQCAGSGSQQNGFFDAITVFFGEQKAGFQGVGAQHYVVRVIAKTISHSIIQSNGLFAWIARRAAVRPCEGLHFGVVAIDKKSWL